MSLRASMHLSRWHPETDAQNSSAAEKASGGTKKARISFGVPRTPSQDPDPLLPHSSATRSPSGSRVRLYPPTAFDHGRRPAPTDSTPSRPTRCARAASSEDLYPPTLPRPYLVSTCTLIPGRIFSSCVRWRAVEARPAKECPRVSRVDLAGWRAHARADDSVGEAAAPAGSGGAACCAPPPSTAARPPTDACDRHLRPRPPSPQRHSKPSSPVCPPDRTRASASLACVRAALRPRS